MRPVLVVVSTSSLGQFAHLLDIPEDICVQYCPAIAAVEAFYIAVLGRFSRLDELMFYPVCLAPDVELLGDELRAVVCPDAFGLAVDEDNLLHNCYDPLSGHRH